MDVICEIFDEKQDIDSYLVCALQLPDFPPQSEIDNDSIPWTVAAYRPSDNCAGYESVPLTDDQMNAIGTQLSMFEGFELNKWFWCYCPQPPNTLENNSGEQKMPWCPDQYDDERESHRKNKVAALARKIATDAEDYMQRPTYTMAGLRKKIRDRLNEKNVFDQPINQGQQMTDLTQKYLKECLDYDPGTGILTWKVKPEHHFKRGQDCQGWNKRFSGEEAGCVDNTGYMRVKMFGSRILSHRLIWLWMTGKLPEDEVDHADHCRANNRWKNLSEATHQENQRNQSLQHRNISGHTGVSWHKPSGKWYASISEKGKFIYLGGFDRIEDAVVARKEANTKYGYHENHGVQVQ